MRFRKQVGKRVFHPKFGLQIRHNPSEIAVWLMEMLLIWYRIIVQDLKPNFYNVYKTSVSFAREFTYV